MLADASPENARAPAKSTAATVTAAVSPAAATLTAPARLAGAVIRWASASAAPICSTRLATAPYAASSLRPSSSPFTKASRRPAAASARGPNLARLGGQHGNDHAREQQAGGEETGCRRVDEGDENSGRSGGGESACERNARSDQGFLRPVDVAGKPAQQIAATKLGQSGRGQGFERSEDPAPYIRQKAQGAVMGGQSLGVAQQRSGKRKGADADHG